MAGVLHLGFFLKILDPKLMLILTSNFQVLDGRMHLYCLFPNRRMTSRIDNSYEEANAPFSSKTGIHVDLVIGHFWRKCCVVEMRLSQHFADGFSQHTMRKRRSW